MGPRGASSGNRSRSDRFLRFLMAIDTGRNTHGRHDSRDAALELVRSIVDATHAWVGPAPSHLVVGSPIAGGVAVALTARVAQSIDTVLDDSHGIHLRSALSTLASLPDSELLGGRLVILPPEPHAGAPTLVPTVVSAPTAARARASGTRVARRAEPSATSSSLRRQGAGVALASAVVGAEARAGSRMAASGVGGAPGVEGILAAGVVDAGGLAGGLASARAVARYTSGAEALISRRAISDASSRAKSVAS